MKKFLFLLFILVHFGVKSANLDSLFQSLKYRSSEIQLEALDSVYKSFRYADSADFVDFHLRALQVKIDWQEKTQLNYIGKYNLARWYIIHDQATKGILALSQLANEIKTERYPEIKTHVLLSLSSAYHEMGSIERALEYSLLAIDCLKHAHDTTFLPKAFNTVGETYRTMNDFESAISYYNLGLSSAKAQKDSFLIGMISSNKGIALTKLNRFEEAQESLKFGYEVALKTGNKFGQAVLLTNSGFSAKEEKDYDQALSFYAQSLAIKEDLGNKRSLAYTLNDIGETHYLMGNYAKGIDFCQRALRLIDVDDSPYYMRDFKLTIARLYAANNQFDSAYLYLEDSRELQENLLNENNLAEVARIEQMHKLREKDLENSVLRAQNEANLAELKRGRWLFAFIAVLLIAAFSIGFTLFRSNRIKQAFSAKLEAQNLALSHSNENLNHLLNEQNSLFNIVTHDLKGPLMNSAQLLALESEAETTAEKAKMKNMIQRSVNGALGFISEFNALRELEEKNELPKGEVFNLTAIIKEVLTHFESELAARKIQVHFNDEQNIEVNSVPSFVRHILLNLISNAVKFSPDKGSIFVTISQSESTRISIEDQGTGIKPENMDRIFERFFRAPAGLVSAKSNGLGLSLVKLLVEKLGGKISVKSILNKGSEFIVSIP